VRSAFKQQFKKQEKNMLNRRPEKFQLQVKPNRELGDLPMLHQLIQNKLSRLMLAAGLCLTTVFVSQLDLPVAKVTEKNLSGNGLVLNGTSFNGTNLNGANLNGTSLNGASLNGRDLGANGVYFKRFGLTSSTIINAVFKQKPIQKIRLEGGQLALKIKRSD
jgi:uncharacterized protein YjbI with pentapeptide repeats